MPSNSIPESSPVPFLAVPALEMRLYSDGQINGEADRFGDSQ